MIAWQDYVTATHELHVIVLEVQRPPRHGCPGSHTRRKDLIVAHPQMGWNQVLCRGSDNIGDDG